MLTAAVIVVVSYAIGSVPVAYLVGRLTKGVDIREVGSGNVGASNVWQSVSRALVVPVGVAQIAQGLAGVLIAKAAGEGEGAQVAAGLAAVLANDWNPWLGFAGGRGIGQSIGFLLVLSPAGLAAFIVVALTGVGMKAIPQFVALALLGAPVATLLAGGPGTVAAGAALLAAIALAKRVLANGPPDASYARPGVWWNRLVYDRDIRDREAWVRRGLS
jgi:glycerol-3-phosphate acyltransferase PlsY